MSISEKHTGYEVVVPPVLAQALRDHLLADRSCEQMAVTLCGLHRLRGRLRLLTRHLILIPPEGFARQSATGLVLDQAIQRHILQLAAHEGLSQVDWHTHPGDGAPVSFSSTDDRNEERLARYLHQRLPRTLYASVVLNGTATAARVWEVENGKAVSIPMRPPNLSQSGLLPGNRDSDAIYESAEARFDRQVRAFGAEFQQRLRRFRVGVVGLGGIGSLVVEQLARLGVRHWVLVDPDRVEASNLNRLHGATMRDVAEERPKGIVAARTIKQIDPGASVISLSCSNFAPRALRALASCDLLIAATDTHASRLVLNALSCQYLIPLVHIGVNLETQTPTTLADVSGECALPPLGEWCLLCAGIIDSQRAGWELARPEEKASLQKAGYLDDTPSPAVYHLNGVIASLGVTEIHNAIWPYKPVRRYLMYRELEGELMAVEVPRHKNCMHCGQDGLLGLGELVPLWTPRRGRTRSIPDVPVGARSSTETEGLGAHDQGERA